ncbi:hypothetical protein GPZ77_32000 [Streptomyces sp. QHH-9511]|uniref:hypothetical protein n=1 Tax=Streptomyces sp. QHH-9511 TaxID=2684468 RepID=UPI0013167499|nr:hypothetical protein [Streptomyces sp. QHH-9511]QGZ52343.1 hypothetical protein GPZ77_32000 [Streptomyces sp. QHH-9511]GGT85937.1 hypothetical protein GCM10010272_33450 [Streptomyces lateritius]
MREHLAASGAGFSDRLYVRGAFRRASRVADRGVHGADTYRIGPLAAAPRGSAARSGPGPRRG